MYFFGRIFLGVRCVHNVHAIRCARASSCCGTDNAEACEHERTLCGCYTPQQSLPVGHTLVVPRPACPHALPLGQDCLSACLSAHSAHLVCCVHPSACCAGPACMPAKPDGLPCCSHPAFQELWLQKPAASSRCAHAPPGLHATLHPPWSACHLATPLVCMPPCNPLPRTTHSCNTPCSLCPAFAFAIPTAATPLAHFVRPLPLQYPQLQRAPARLARPLHMEPRHTLCAASALLRQLRVHTAPPPLVPRAVQSDSGGERGQAGHSHPTGGADGAAAGAGGPELAAGRCLPACCDWLPACLLVWQLVDAVLPACLPTCPPTCLLHLLLSGWQPWTDGQARLCPRVPASLYFSCLGGGWLPRRILGSHPPLVLVRGCPPSGALLRQVWGRRALGLQQRHPMGKCEHRLLCKCAQVRVSLIML